MQGEVIKLALERGVLNQEQAEALRQLTAEIAGKAETAGDNIIAPRIDEPVGHKTMRISNLLAVSATFSSPSDLRCFWGLWLIFPARQANFSGLLRQAAKRHVR